MAQQEEPLYDFPEPSQPSDRRCAGLQRGRDSLRSVSVLDRLLLTVPVWLQLSINPATALHILQRESTGAFLVRNSRTSNRKVLCVRLADDSVPSFVQQYCIGEELSTFSLDTSAISFPDVPRLIAFYCVSRDILPFPLELPEAIARATSHKQLESISHMGVEFWSSQLNFRGPKVPRDEEKRPKPATAPQSIPTPSAGGPAHLNPAHPLSTPPRTDASDGQSESSNATLFQEFCPIRTRSPRELNCGTGLVALCFVNPLFLQSQTALHRRRMFKRSVKVRVSTEGSSALSPPLVPPPPPPLMPKTKGRRKAKVQTPGQPPGHPLAGLCPPGQSQGTQGSPEQRQDVQLQPRTPNTQEDAEARSQDGRVQETQETQAEAQTSPQCPPPKPKLPPGQFRSLMRGQDRTQGQTQTEEGLDQTQGKTQTEEGLDQTQKGEGLGQTQTEERLGQTQTERLGLPATGAGGAEVRVTTDLLLDDSDYKQPSSRANVSPSISLSPYLSPSPSPGAPPSLFPKASRTLSPHSLSPYQSPSVSPKVLSFPPFPFVASPSTSPTTDEEAYHTPTGLLTPRGLLRGGGEGGEEERGEGEVTGSEEEEEEVAKEMDGEEMSLLLQQMYASSLMGSCSSLSSLEEAAETLPPTPLEQDGGVVFDGLQ